MPEADRLEIADLRRCGHARGEALPPDRGAADSVGRDQSFRGPDRTAEDDR